MTQDVVPASSPAAVTCKSAVNCKPAALNCWQLAVYTPASSKEHLHLIVAAGNQTQHTHTRCRPRRAKLSAERHSKLPIPRARRTLVQTA